MSASLTGRSVLVVGRGSGIARATTLAVRAAGGEVVVAGRDRKALAEAYDDPGVTAEEIDLTDESSVRALAERLGTIDHVVSTASARARGQVGDLSPDTVAVSFGSATRPAAVASTACRMSWVAASDRAAPCCEVSSGSGPGRSRVRRS